MRGSVMARWNPAACAFVIIMAGATPGPALAGDLDPPAGSIAPTMLPLDDAEPRVPVGPTTTPGTALSTYVISTPGSYFLTQDLIQEPSKDGIRINAPGVTLDLRGFTIKGMSGDGYGIYGLARDLRIFNGTIETFDQIGVNLLAAPNCLLEDLRAYANGESGFWVTGSSIVRSCMAHENGQHGFLTNGIVVFESCSAVQNGTDGFNAFGTLTNCLAIANTGDGFEVANGALSNCSSHGNTGNGFVIGEYGETALANCSATLNNQGFVAIGRSTFENCSTRQSTLDGFSLQAGCTLTSCTATWCGDDGFQLATASTVTMCRSVQNSYGFYVPLGEDLVRIDSCTANWNTTNGLLISGGSCTIVRNMARGNGTDFAFAGACQYGPIVSGNGTITSTSPWANFGDTTAAKNESLPMLERKDREAAAAREARAPIPAPEDPRTLRTIQERNPPR